MPIEKLKFSTFESLDELMQIITIKAWVALCSLIFLFSCGVLWLFFGKIPTKISGTGMLINVSGIETIYSNVSGKITVLNINIGDSIKKGEPVAYILQWSLKNEIEKHSKAIQEKVISNKQKELIRDKQEIKYQKELADYQKQLALLINLEKSGAASEKEIIDMRSQITQTENKVDDLKIQKIKDTNELNDLERELETMKRKYDIESVIRSPQNGTVVEISRAAGDLLAFGDEIATLEADHENTQHLKAIIYVSAFEGKKITPGMTVLISPSTVKAEEYGSMIGKVSAVSAYPATFKTIMRILHNEEIVKQILSKGNQIEANIELTKNPKTISGYQWTSQEGPPISIQSGTLCDANIIVKRSKPIELIIPKIKKWASIEGEY